MSYAIKLVLELCLSSDASLKLL